MKILTWNLQRLEKNKSESILAKFAALDADILILTETDSKINPGELYSSISSKSLSKNFDGIDYKNTENRTTIWTKYKTEIQYKTFDDFTSVCVDIQTPFGLLNFYGTIIGVFGGKGERFKSDLDMQIADFKKLSGDICIAGDFNVFFSGYAYPSHQAKNKLNEIFEKLNLVNLTADLDENANHIVLSRNVIRERKPTIEIWNENKMLSDHIGICITL